MDYSHRQNQGGAEREGDYQATGGPIQALQKSAAGRRYDDNDAGHQRDRHLRGGVERQL